MFIACSSDAQVGIKYVIGVPTPATYTPNFAKKESAVVYSTTAKKMYRWNGTDWTEIKDYDINFIDGGGVKYNLDPNTPNTHFFSLGDDFEVQMPLVHESQNKPNGQRQWIWTNNKNNNFKNGFGYMQTDDGNSDTWIFGAPNIEEVVAKVEYNTYEFPDENSPITFGSHNFSNSIDLYQTNRPNLTYNNINTNGQLEFRKDLIDSKSNVVEGVKLSDKSNFIQLYNDSDVWLSKFDVSRNDVQPPVDNKNGVLWTDETGVLKRTSLASFTNIIAPTIPDVIITKSGNTVTANPSGSTFDIIKTVFYNDDILAATGGILVGELYKLDTQNSYGMPKGSTRVRVN